jgi:hypothetical protein
MNRFLMATVMVSLTLSAQLCLSSTKSAQNHDYVEQAQVGPSALEQVRDMILNIEDKISRLNGKKFVLILRFTKTTRRPDSQIIFTKFADGHTEILLEQMSRPTSAYFPDDIPEESLTQAQLSAIAKRIPIRRTLVRKAPDTVEYLLSQFLEMRVSPLADADLPLDGTQYDLWYAVPDQTIHITQHGPVVGAGSPSNQPVKWMNEVYTALGIG